MSAPFQSLKVWQLSHKLAIEIYRVTSSFPASERFGLASQLRRAAVAIPSNIVEGNARNHRREYVQFCHVARSSLAEVKYLLLLCSDINLVSKATYRQIQPQYEALGAMLFKFIRSMDDIK